MNHGSLFSGIGGFDLVAEWMGWDNVFHCEWNEFGQKVLKYYWPKAISYHDITKTDFSIHRGEIDILTGGFPCQPYSAAGKRLGKEDERHLWPEMLRAIQEIQPTWIVGENVLGLVNWNGGLVFEEVQADLEAEGYEVQPYILPACAVNAPHRRDRVWFVAYSENYGCTRINQFGKNLGIQKRSVYEHKKEGWDEVWAISERHSKIKPSPNTQGNGLNDKSTEANHRIWEGNQQSGTQRISTFEGLGNERTSSDTCINGMQGQPINSRTSEEIGQRGQSFKEIRNFGYIGTWDNFPTVSPIHTRDDGISSKLDGITFPKWRNESIKAGGNAVVPQVVYQIFKAIQQYDRTTTNQRGNYS